MIDGYKLLLASDISDRDGMGLEIYNDAGQIAEIFRDDTTGEVSFNTDAPVRIPISVLEQFIAEAKRDLSSAQ